MKMINKNKGTISSLTTANATYEVVDDVVDFKDEDIALAKTLGFVFCSYLTDAIIEDISMINAGAYAVAEVVEKSSKKKVSKDVDNA